MKVLDDAYIINGKEYVRVTKVLDIIATPEFYRWFGKHGYDKCKSIMETRAAFGTRVHKEIQNYLEGKEVWVDNDEMRRTIALFSAWAGGHSLCPLHLECSVKSDVFMFAGTVDYIGDFDSVKTLIDWKTSKRIYDNMYLQAAAYWFAYEEMFPDEPRIEQARIIGFRDGKISSVKFNRKRAEELFEVFKCARKIYEWKYKK
jgi:CRISPR/Cas system-associated exonuclease Cas4 (RecB family)